MRTIYIGAEQKTKKNNGGFKWKVYAFLFVFFVASGYVINFSAPLYVEHWINQKGEGAFSIRDVEISLAKTQLVLKDLRINNPKKDTELIDAPHLIIQFDWPSLLTAETKKVALIVDKMDIILHQDFTAEIERLKAFKLDVIEARIGELKVIERKADRSRTILDLKDVTTSFKADGFVVNSTISDGGKFILSRKGDNFQGSLIQVPAELLSKLAGDKLPFSFNEPRMNATITAQLDQGKVSGVISPEVKRLNLVGENQTIARALTEELTFTLPFTMTDELRLDYAETYRKLKAYRKHPTPTVGAGSAETRVTQTGKEKKTFSFWPF